MDSLKNELWNAILAKKRKKTPKNELRQAPTEKASFVASTEFTDRNAMKNNVQQIHGFASFDYPARCLRKQSLIGVIPR
jgi:hypothetical protein